MRKFNKLVIKNPFICSLKSMGLGVLLSSCALVSVAYSQTPPKFAYPEFAYFLDNVGDIFNADGSVKPLAGTVIGQQNSTQRQAVTKAGGISGYSAAFNVAAGYRSYVSWTDTTNGNSLQQIFNNPKNASLSPSQLATLILKAVGINSSDPNQFPQPNESDVIWAQDIEQNTCNKELITPDYGCPVDQNTSFAQPIGYTNAAAAYTALFWAGRVLLPNMTIIPVPGSFILKVGNGGGTGPSWNLPSVINGVAGGDAYLSLLEPVLKIKSSLGNQLSSIQTNNVDLLSFLHMASYNNRYLIDGFLAQQYSCKNINNNPPYDSTGELECNAPNPGALPGNFSQADTPPIFDKTLPYAIMSAHDNPNQITYNNTAPLSSTLNPAPNTWTSNYNPNPNLKSPNNVCLPFLAGVYWSNEDSDLSVFNPKQYLTPTQASSTSLTSINTMPSRRQSYGSFNLSVQVQGSSAGANGSVTSTNTSISCNSKNLFGCSQSVGANQTVTLVANPAPGRKFLYWTGTDNCKGNNPTCSLPVKANTQVGACFQ